MKRGTLERSKRKKKLPRILRGICSILQKARLRSSDGNVTVKYRIGEQLKAGVVLASLLLVIIVQVAEGDISPQP